MTLFQSTLNIALWIAAILCYHSYLKIGPSLFVLSIDVKPEASTEYVVINTANGALRGVVETVSGVRVNIFRGVKYCEPNATNPFGPCQPIALWKGVRDAIHHARPFYQSIPEVNYFGVHPHVAYYGGNMTDDAFTMDIYAPAEITTLRPTYIFFPGGGFRIGGSSFDEYDGRLLAARHGIVVAFTQYRIGFTGYLDMKNPKITGNGGLNDQLVSLRFVNKHIHVFGGDRNLVTIGGTSAGAMSVGILIRIPQAIGLFKRAIIQSGSVLLVEEMVKDSENAAIKLAQYLGCYQSGQRSVYSQSVVQCVLAAPKSSLHKAEVELFKDDSLMIGPTKTGNLLKRFAENKEVLQSLKAKQLLIGSNRHEGVRILLSTMPHRYTPSSHFGIWNSKKYKQILRELMMGGGLSQSETELVANWFGSSPSAGNPAQYAYKLADFLGDFCITCPVLEEAKQLASLFQSVHMYRLDHNPKESTLPAWPGPSHHDEMQLIFGYPDRYPQLYTERDRQVSRLMERTWAHFIITGQIPQDQFDQPWTVFKPYKENFMEIGTGNCTMLNGDSKSNCVPLNRAKNLSKLSKLINKFF